MSMCCCQNVVQRKSQKLEILAQLFLNGNQQKEHILDYTLCDFQVVLLKREFSTVFQSYLGSKKVRIPDLFCGHFRPRWRKLKYNKIVTGITAFCPGFLDSFIEGVFVSLLVKILSNLVNIRIFQRYLSIGEVRIADLFNVVILDQNGGG